MDLFSIIDFDSSFSSTGYNYMALFLSFCLFFIFSILRTPILSETAIHFLFFLFSTGPAFEFPISSLLLYAFSEFWTKALFSILPEMIKKVFLLIFFYFFIMFSMFLVFTSSLIVVPRISVETYLLFIMWLDNIPLVGVLYN